jgi:Fe-S-cluster containining protein
MLRESDRSSKSKKSFPEIRVEMTPETKCSFCTNSKCCTYITQEIPTPRSKYDFEHLLWQLSHEDIQCYRDDEGWYLLVNRKCTHLQSDGRCGIYETRPQVCRDHTNDYCEFDSPAEDSFELFFDGYESLLKFCKKRFKTWRK